MSVEGCLLIIRPLGSRFWCLEKIWAEDLESYIAETIVPRSRNQESVEERTLILKVYTEKEPANDSVKALKETSHKKTVYLKCTHCIQCPGINVTDTTTGP